MNDHAITYGSKRIHFLLEKKSRKSVRISVMPDLTVSVSAPCDASIDQVLVKVQKRSAWIAKQIDYFQSFLPKELPRQFISGETHYYCGRQYRLKVVKADYQVVKLKGGYIYVFSLKPECKTRTKHLLYEWYRLRAVEMFWAIVYRCYEKLNKYGIKLPVMDVRRMKSRWGSCMVAKNKIGLNTELIKAPTHCIEYVIMHEMCHLKYPNHTKKFYSFLALVLPGWKKRKARLERVIL